MNLKKKSRKYVSYEYIKKHSNKDVHKISNFYLVKKKRRESKLYNTC